MTTEERTILEEIKEALPKLTDEDKERLLWFCKGMATKRGKESTNDTEERND